MKKLNLIKRLSRNSHEKQSPQWFGRYAAMLIMLLTLGVGQMWAGDREVFIDLSEAQSWYTNPEVNHGTGSSYTVTAASSTGVTNLYKVTIPDTDNWEVCRDGGNNKLAWQAYNSGKNKVRVYNTGNGGCATNIVGSVSGGYIYFDNSVSNFETPLYFVIGHDHNYWGEDNLYTKSYVMTNVTGTNLYYVGISDTWADAEFFAVIGSSKDLSGTGWGSSSIGSKGDRGNTAAYTGPYSLNSGSTYLVTTASSGNGQPMTITYKGTSYSSLNTTHTVEQVLSINGGSTYSAATKSIATTVSVSARALTNNGISGTSTGTITSGNSSANCSALRQQTVTYSVTAKTGYTFNGWWDGATRKETKTTYTYTEAGSNKTITAKFSAVRSTITLRVNDGSESSVTQTATYGETTISRSSARPTRTGYAFDGYYTAASGGTQVINKDGNWNSNVDGFTDSNGKWICTSAQTLHAHWLEVGWYIVGESDYVGGWVPQAAYKFDNTNHKCTVTVANHGIYSGSSYLKEFKICKVDENTSSAKNETLYGKNTDPTSAVEIGKDNKTVSGLTNGGYEHAIKQQLYYDGNYIYTLNTSGPDITVDVPVVDQLQIYESDPSGAIGIANHNWSSPSSSIVTKTVTLAHTTTYQFKAVYESEYYGYGTDDTYITLGRSTDSTLLAKSTNNIKILTDVKGNYKFDYNIKTHKIKVTYPEKRLVTYSIVTIGGGTGTESSLTATNDDDSNVSISTLSNYVADGDHVTFTAPTESTGYTFRGWYSTDEPNTSDWSQDQLSSSKTYSNVSVSGGNLTVYAIYSQNEYAVTVSAGTHGSVSPSGSVLVKQVTGTSLEASPDNSNQYTFKDWTIANGGIAPNESSTNPQSFTATTTGGTIQANFGSKWAVAGNDDANTDPDDAMGNWDVWTKQLENYASKTVSGNVQDTCWVNISLPANSKYQFKVRDNTYGSTAWYGNNTSTQYMTYSANNKQEWLFTRGEGANCGIITAGKGTYRFSWNISTNNLRVTYPTSWTVTYGKKVIYNNDNTSLTDADTEGSIVSVVDGDAIALESGKYVVGGGSVTVVAEPATGYEIAGWYSDAACTSAYTSGEGGVTISGEGNTNFTITGLAANTGIYVKFSEIMTTVTFAHNSHGHVEISGETVTSTKVGVHTTPSVTASADANYYFAGWIRTEGSDYSISDDFDDEDDYETNLSGNGAGATSGQTLTAKFVELEKVYFRNWDAAANSGAGASLWTNVYVYFDIDYQDDCAKSNSSSSMYTQMSQEGTTNVYWAYVPRSVTRYTKDDIAFSNHDFGTGTKFGGYEAVMRGDYRSGLSMFVPRTASTYTRNTTKYYNGYWKHHNLEPGTISGYTIERYNGSGYERPADNGADRDHFIVLNEDKIQYSLRVDNVTSGYNNYRVKSDGNIHYITREPGEDPDVDGYTIETDNYSDIPMSEYNSGSPRFYITPTTQNLYTLTIDQSGDEMKLTVDYPVALGDYRIVHTYSSGTKKAYSDIIKSSEAASGVTASMYINTSGSPTLTLEKCTAITPSVTWTAQTQGSVWSSYYRSFTENGVYKFDVTITKDDVNNYGSTISDITNIGIYDGEFYIKTDCGKGGWTAWKANVMEKNTITFKKADATTFDHSYCHWVGNVRGDAKPTNVKCVIANDYNIAVSDTLVGDEILGTYKDKDENDVPYENLPSAAHVRFSYNSTTNELKRTYLAVEGVDHLVLEGNKSAGGDYMILNSSGADFDDENKAVLGNQSNFTFMLDITAREKARVRLSAKYNGKIQDLVGHITSNGYGEDLTAANTVEIIGGSIEKDRYDNLLRITYDFKTNQLLSAWLAPTSSNSPNKAINADVMIIREGQDDARQITFANSSDKLSAVDTVYGVMKFEKSTLNNSSLSPYERDLYWISFPFAVKLSDAFGMGTYGTHWIIERYDGKGRAKNGFWADSESNWKFVTPYERDNGFIMNANEGYILALDLDELGEGSLVWDNDMTDAYLYFPSKDKVGNIKTKDVTVEIDTVGYTCTIGPRFENGDDRRIKDSHWHCIGAPSFANINHAATTGWVDENSDGINDYPNAGTIESWKSSSVLYVYDWNSTYNTLTPVSAASHNFKAMHSYMVQYSQPSISWSSVTTPSASIAARMTETPDREYELALLREDDEQDHTFVRLTDDVNVSTGFEFNYDLSKEMNRNRGNIWTVTADTVQVAGNSQPHPLTTTIVPVGVKIAANGEYTFSMPEGTNGGDVWLIDNANNLRTNLGLMDYTVNLTTGTYEGRFSLEFPVQNVVTEIENAANANANANADDAVRKVFVGGQLYIIRDGVIYNASGARVQ